MHSSIGSESPVLIEPLLLLPQESHASLLATECRSPSRERKLILPRNDFIPVCRLVDKMPDWVEKYRAEGLEETQIDQLINEKKLKYIQKWGNNSRVGVLLNSYNQNKTQEKFLAVTPKRYGHSINSFDQGNPGARDRMSSLPTIERN